MAKKGKNSLLNIHYSRTMTSDNLSKAANYVGKYVLKGLGTFGKIMASPFISQGPTSANIYKSKELLAKERTIENKSEELLGKAMAWASPLNYGAALATGNGLNARKGEKEVASWSPAWQAVGRLGELYVGPKAVKGIKSAPKSVVNTVAKAGNKTARAYLISKEIGKGTINLKELSNQFIEPHVTNPKGSGKVVHYDNGDGKSVFRNSGASIRNGKLVPGQTTRNQSNFTWWNKDNPYLNVHKSQGRFSPSRYITVDLTNLFVHPLKAGKSVGLSDGAGRGFILPTEVVSEIPVDLSNASIIQKSPFGWWERVKSYQPKLLLDSPTSLKFFERKPSRISDAERFGVPKGERNLSNIISKFGNPFTYDENGLFIPNPNYNFRNGWGLIGDAIKTGKIRVPEGDYKPAVLKKYPFLNKSIGPFSTVRDFSFNFPYFLRGESIFPFKTQVLAEDLIAVPNNLPGVSWNKVGKFNTIFENEIANVGDKTTPIINGKLNIFPSDKALFFRLNKATNKYEPYEIIPKSEGWGVYSNKYNKSFSTTYFEYPNYMDEPINIKKKKQGGKMNILKFLKNGSSIHIKPSLKINNEYITKMLSGGGIYIKPKNRGSFRRYCHGKVTSECIARGKRSSNPVIRKRSTFADNARKWKHLLGGAFVEGVNILDSNPNAYKYVKRKYKMHQEGGLLNYKKNAKDFLNNWYNERKLVGYPWQLADPVFNTLSKRLNNTDISYSRKLLGADSTDEKKYLGEHFIYSDGTEGIWINPNYKGLQGTTVHEMSHTFNNTRPTIVILDILNKRLKNNSLLRTSNSKLDNNSYVGRPNEIYSEINRVRFENNLKPKRRLTKKDISKLKKLDWLNIYSDDTLLDLFNNVAQNNSSKNNNISLALLGSKLETIGNVINSGQSILNGILSSVNTNKYINLLKDNINLLYKLMKNKIDVNQINYSALLNLNLKMALNPEINYGEIDLQQERERLKKDALNKATLEADNWKNQAMIQLNNQASSMKSQQQEQLLNGIGSLVNTGINYFGNKKNTTSIPETRTFNNYTFTQPNFKVNMSLNQ